MPTWRIATLGAAAVMLSLVIAGESAGSTQAVTDNSVRLAKDEIVGDSDPAGDVAHAGVPYTGEVSSAITGSGDLTLTIAGDAECDPHWSLPMDPFPSLIGEIQTSVVTIPSASGVVVSEYSIACPVGGPFAVNITSHVRPEAGEDVTNNMDENWVQVVVSCDADADGLCSPEDNCPDVATPWTVPEADSDCDGFSDYVSPGSHGLEGLNGTDPKDACPDHAGDKAWPPDTDNSGTVALPDVVLFGRSLNQSGAGYDPRFDLDASGKVMVSDIVAMGPFFNKSCVP